MTFPNPISRCSGATRERLAPISRIARCGAFSLIEIMVTVGLLSFIVLGLLAMFHQTQKAFRSGITQSDVLESGRATMEMIAREIEQMKPAQSPDYFYKKGLPYRGTNFFAEPSPGFYDRVVQALPGSAFFRTNYVQRFGFTTQLNQDWIGIGYQVLPLDASGSVGSLYRFSTTNWPRSGRLRVSELLQGGMYLALLNNDRGLPVTNVVYNPGQMVSISRIAEGVVHLRLQAYAANGSLLTTNQFTGTNVYALAGYDPNRPYYLITNVHNTIVCDGKYGGSYDPQLACYFMSNAAPAYLELELGMLEPQVLQRYRSIAIDSARRDYISNHVGQVHIFRQRIPIRNVDLSAYPVP